MTATVTWSFALDLVPPTPAWRDAELGTTDGRFLAVSNAAGGGIAWSLRDAAGATTASGVVGGAGEAAAAATALRGASGGFVIVDERTNTPTDRDVMIHVRAADGSAVADLAIATLDDDRAPRVVALADGGFAVVWLRADPSGGQPQLWTAVWEADGSLRDAPHEIPTVNGANFVDVTALQTGGYAIATSDGAEATVRTLDAHGAVIHESVAVVGIDDAIALLPNGYLLDLRVDWANDNFLDYTLTPYGPGETWDSWYVYGRVIDPATGAVVIDDLLRGQTAPDGLGFAAWDPAAWRNILGGVSLSWRVDDERWGWPLDPYTIWLDRTVETHSIDLVRTTTGDATAETLIGDALVDRMFGAGGVDRLEGRGGNDVLDGGAGADTMIGGAGDDSYVVDNAGDVVVEAAGEGADTVSASVSWTLGAEVENLTLTGAADIDGVGNDRANVLTGNAGANLLTGRGGDDTYIVGAGDQVVEAAGGGIDAVFSSVDFILGDFVENLTLTGTGATRATGNALANTLVGNAADNILIGLGGADSIDGGAGVDGVDYSASAAKVVVDLSTGLGRGGDAQGDRLTRVENLVGSAFDDALTGDGAANRLSGGLGADLINGGGGSDYIDGGAGLDRMTGGLGNDVFVVDFSSDRVTERIGEGRDTVLTSANWTMAAGSEIEELRATVDTGLRLIGNEFDSTIRGGGGADIIDGRGGADLMYGGAGDDTYYVDEPFNGRTGDRVFEDVGGGVDTVISTISFSLLGLQVENLRAAPGAGGLSLTGNDLVNDIRGGGGDDTLDGRAGADFLRGGLGDDIYVVDDLGDVVLEYRGQGVDTIKASLDWTLVNNVENLTLTGSADLDGFGNGLDNTLIGNSGANRLDGRLGADLMQGGVGDDVYIVDNVGDVVKEFNGQGDDSVFSSVSFTLQAWVERLTLTGAAAIDGAGNASANTIVGNAKANRLDGAGGSDTLTGGGGADRFVFSTALSATTNLDTITDFAVADDLIELSAAIFTKAGALGALSADAFCAGAAALDASDRILWDAATGTLFYDRDGVGAAAPIAFAHLTPGLALTAANFFVA